MTTPQNTKPFQTTSTLPPPTYTPLPTLNPTDAAKQIEQLFTANSSCRLPCYRGITPGKSKWPEVNNYLLSFADKYGWSLPYYGFGYNLPKELGGGQQQQPVTVTVHGRNEIKLIHTAWYGYSIHELLADYGRPAEIYIFVLPVPFSPPGIVELVFYYPEHGFMALFEGKIGNGKRLVICPDHQDVMGTRSVLWIWNPDETNSLQDLSRSDVDLRDSWEYQPLQAATGMTVDEFYSTYSDPVEFRKCFDMANPYQ